jgi:hypothetical protein
MLNRAFCVQERITKFVRSHKADPEAIYQPWNDRLVKGDWTHLERLKKALQSFEAATIVNQGHDAYLSGWFTTLHTLLNSLDNWKIHAVEVLGDDELAACFTASWNKIEKYYKLVDRTPVYYAAILLDPTLKLQKLREMWHTDETRPWIEPVVELVRQMWLTDYKPRYKHLQSYPKEQTVYDDEDSAFSLFSNAKRLCLSVQNEPVDPFEAYLAVAPSPSIPGQQFDVIGWWQLNKHAFPGLAFMAYDVFSIPLMSDENERCFSTGRDMITYRRTSLMSDIIEACQCLKSWYSVDKRPWQEPFDDEDDILKEMEATEEPEVIG